MFTIDTDFGCFKSRGWRVLARPRGSLARLKQVSPNFELESAAARYCALLRQQQPDFEFTVSEHVLLKTQTERAVDRGQLPLFSPRVPDIKSETLATSSGGNFYG